MRQFTITIGVIACLALLVQPGESVAGTGDGSVLSTTKVLDNGPDAQRYNIVIMGDGYQAAEIAAYEARVQDVVNAFTNQVVYGACDTSVNIYRVNIQSDDSGVDKPTPCYATSTLRDTYLDTKYCGGGSTQRCIGSSNSALIQATATAATANWHFVLVLVNDAEHGGCRWGNISYSATGAGFERTTIHELGHAIGNLADEYEEFAGTHSGGDPGRANLTVATNRGDVKWHDLILPTTPVPTWQKTDCTAFQNPPATWGDTVGTFEGGNRYSTCGIYRSQRTCLMRSSTQPFCAACSRRLRQVFNGLSPDANLSIAPWGYFRTPRVTPHWQTDDIWVDNDGDGSQGAGEPSLGKADNHLYARITNSGGAPSGTYDVSFYYVPFTGVIDMANRQHIATVSRPSLAVGGVDEFDVLWDLTSVPPAFSGIDHFCVIVEIESDECATYDNRAQNNFNNVPTVGPSPAPVSLYVKNILPQDAVGRVIVEPRPPTWELAANVPDLDSIPLRPNEEKLITVEFVNDRACVRRGRQLGAASAAARAGDLSVCTRQRFDLSFELEGDVLGGVSSEIVVRRPPHGFSLHLGRTLPTGDLDQVFDPGIMVGLDYSYHLTPRWSIVGLVGYNEFAAGVPFVTDTHLWNLSVNGRYELGTGGIRPYVNGGVGFYVPERGSGDPGVNLGLGLLRDLTSRTVFDVGGDYHRILVDGDEVEFFVARIGLVIVF